MNDWIIYLGTGCVTGLLAGLFGIGGGLIMVPILLYVFTKAGFPAQYLMYMALATSLAVIMLSSISSARSHHQHQNVNWAIVKVMAISVFVGTMLGSLLASKIHIDLLKLLFIGYTFYVATQILWGFSVNPSRQLPGWRMLSVTGMCIGLVSSFVGIGGGTLTVPFLMYCNIDPKRAIGTSSAIGAPIALGGVIGYVIAGYEVHSLPMWSIGFVYLPALIAIAFASLITTPIGAKLVQKLPVQFLKRMFAFLLYAIGMHMLFSIL